MATRDVASVAVDYLLQNLDRHDEDKPVGCVLRGRELTKVSEDLGAHPPVQDHLVGYCAWTWGYLREDVLRCVTKTCSPTSAPATLSAIPPLVGEGRHTELPDLDPSHHAHDAACPVWSVGPPV